MKVIWLNNNKNQKIHVNLSEKSKTTVFILFHGMFGNNKRPEILQTTKYLVEKNYSVLSFDYLGHGKSYGKFSELNLTKILNNKKLVMNYAKKHFKEIYLIGFSFGAHPSIFEAATNNKIKGLVLFNPATNMLQLVTRRKTQKNFEKETKEKEITFFKKIKFIIDYLKYNLYNASKNISCPVYVYHIINDNSVPVTQSYKFKKYIKSKNKFVHEKGSGHSMEKELDNRTFTSKILPDAINWIEKNSS